MAGARGDRERAAELRVRVVRDALELHSLRDLVAAASNASSDFVLLGRWGEAAAYAEQAFAAAVQSRDHICICSAVCNGSWGYMVLGVPAAAQRLVQALPADEELSSMERLWAASSRGHEAASASRHAEAVKFFFQALRLLRACGNRVNEVDVLPWLLRSLVHCGRLADAEVELKAARSLVGVTAQGQLDHCEALLAHARGQPEKALQSLALMLGDAHVAPLWRAWAVWDAAWLLAEAGRGAEALTRLEHQPPRFDALPLAAIVAARVHLALGDTEAAQRCHGQYLAGVGHGVVPPYFETLGDCFAGTRPIPRAPCLPSRL
jgi:hypothetical protein